MIPNVEGILRKRKHVLDEEMLMLVLASNHRNGNRAGNVVEVW